MITISRNLDAPHIAVEIGLPPAHRGEQTNQTDNLPSPTTARGSSKNVAFHTKLAAMLKIGVGTAVPVAAVSMAVDMAVCVLWNTAQHIANSAGSDIKIKLAAAAMEIAADATTISVVTVAGHTYLDKKFYYDRDKSADEMIATKKANSAVFACIGGTSTSIAMTLAATALTGGTVTTSVVTTALATHAIGRLIATPAVLGVAALGCGLKKGEYRQPDSLQAGLEDYAAWICETLGGSDAQKTSSSAESHRQEVPEVAPGDDMV